MSRGGAQLFWFSVSGLLGLLVDTVVLYLLLSLLGPYVARLFSFLSAAVVTWLINRNLTFRNRSSGKTAGHEFFLYFFMMLFGGFFNYGLYFVLIKQCHIVNQFPIIGVAAGSLAGMLINFTSSKTILFRFSSGKEKD